MNGLPRPARAARWATLALASLLLGCGGGGGDRGGDGEIPAPTDPALNFSFQDAPKAAYAPVDRMGQPVIATVLLIPRERDRFNFSEPANDGDFSSLMLERLRGLHTGLDDAIREKGITPCALDVCTRQVVSRIIPDTLQLDFSQPDGFPNGRRFEDIVVDRVLSLALADITTPGDCNGRPCDMFTFERLPLNPNRNESPFLTQFPYLAAPHLPP